MLHQGSQKLKVCRHLPVLTIFDIRAAFGAKRSKSVVPHSSVYVGCKVFLSFAVPSCDSEAMSRQLWGRFHKNMTLSFPDGFPFSCFAGTFWMSAVSLIPHALTQIPTHTVTWVSRQNRVKSDLFSRSHHSPPPSRHTDSQPSQPPLGSAQRQPWFVIIYSLSKATL